MSEIYDQREEQYARNKKRAVSRKRECAGSVVDLEELRKALLPISQAQTMLEENYDAWNADGKRYAVESARVSLRDAHSRISAIYANAIYGDKPNDHVQREQNKGVTTDEK